MLHRLYSDTQKQFWRFFSDAKLISCRTAEQGRAHLAFILEALDCGRPLLLTDAGVGGTDFFGALTARLKGPSALLGFEGDAGPVAAAIARGKQERCDGVIAVGGGSVLDSAKLVAASLRNGLALEELIAIERLPQPPVPLIAVPTTFGSGSESNMYSHLVSDGRKVGLRKHWLTPAAALLVAEAAFSLPQEARLLTGLDALLHAFEALTLRRETSFVHRTLLSGAIALHEATFLDYVRTPTLDNAEAMATVSTLAGIGMNNARTGLIHTLAVPFARVTGLSHASSLLPFIEPVLALHREEVTARLPALAAASLWECPWSGFTAPIPGRWHLSLTEKDVATLVHMAMEDRVLFKENPVPLTGPRMEQLYRQALAPWLDGRGAAVTAPPTRTH